jgi:predicted ATPase/DNA-binding winged helix-turn-helix (wHTH) protein
MHYTFANCTLDTQRYVLHRAGTSHHLRPKVFQVLQYLMQHRDRVIAKQELAEQLWPAQYISDGVVENTIMAVRRVVGDNGRVQGVIQTLSGHGYRFVAVVAEGQQTAAGDEVGSCAGARTTHPEDEGDVEPLPEGGPATPQASRRQLTVLCYDLVNGPALAGQLACDDLHEVIHAYHTACAEVIQCFAGTIAQTSETGRVVYFGYPCAHEDDAARAVCTGLGLVDALRTLDVRLAHAQGGPLTMRLGIHTGLAVVSATDATAHLVPLALGETPALARQIQMLAPPQTVVISPSTAQLVEGLFVCRPLEPSLSQGIPMPDPLVQVLQTSEPRHCCEGTRRHGLSPMVGRADEMELLQRRWQQAQQGLGQGILLWGEPGIGKSRLVDALRAWVGSQASTVRSLRCSPYAQQSALFPVIASLQQHLQWHRHAPAATKLARLEQTLRESGIAVQESLPLLAPLLALPLAESPLPLSVSPERHKHQTLEALASWLLGTAPQQPALVVWEDMHWADPSSLELLRLVIDQLPLAPVLLLVTCRPCSRPPWPVRSYLTERTLNRLPACQVEQMVAYATAGKVVPPAVLQEVLVKSDGVPLFVEELLKMLMVSGVIRADTEPHEASASLTPLAIPHTLQGLLLARLDHLDATGREVAQLSAVLGREFRYEVLQAMAPMDETRLQQGLTQLVNAELLYQRGLPPQASYCFKHALIQEAAYQSLVKRTRQQYHYRLAGVLEAQGADTVEVPPELLAYHYTEAGCAEPAIRYWQLAGHQASGRCAYVEAVRYLRHGLDLLNRLPETPERLHHELALRTLLGPALMALKGYGAPEVQQVYAQARQLCLQVNDHPQLFRALWGLYSFYIVRGQCRTAHELVQQCLRMARRADDPALLLRAHVGMGESLFWLGDVHAACAHLAQGLALYEAQSPPAAASFYGHDPGVLAYTYTALTLWWRGYPDQALQACQHALSLAEELAHPHSVVWAAFFMATVHNFRRETLAVQEHAEAILTLAAEHGLPFWQAGGAILRGWSLTMQGQAATGLSLMHQGLDAYHTTGAVLGRPYFLALLADAYGATGQITAGLEILAEALDAGDNGREHGFVPELHRLQGELLLRQSDCEQGDRAAEACYLRALHLAQQEDAPMWKLRAAMSLCRLWQRQGQAERGQQILAEAYTALTEGFATADLQEASVLLAV